MLEHARGGDDGQLPELLGGQLGQALRDIQEPLDLGGLEHVGGQRTELLHVLLATEGCMPSAKGARVRIDGGEITVTDGPFPETKELIAGYCLIEVKTKAEAIEWTKRFIQVVGRGESEIREICPPRG